MILRMSTRAPLDKPDDAETEQHARSGRRTTLANEQTNEAST